MDNSERLTALKALRRPKADTGFKTSQDFTDWQGRIAPLLNFSETYHSLFTDLVSKTFEVSGLPARLKFYRQLDGIIAQAITELERGLTPKRGIELTGDHGVWWFFTHCKSKVQVGFLAWFFGLIVAAFLLGLGLGSNHFFMRLYDLYVSSTKPAITSPLTTVDPTNK